jgi:hypothetical protein
MEYAMIIVKEKKPTPPAAARFYAYVSTVYSETLMATKDVKQAGLATSEIILYFYPEKASEIKSRFIELGFSNNFVLNKSSSKIVEKYKEKLKIDKRSSVVAIEPKGEQYWVGTNALEPGAGSWKRWIVEGGLFEVPPPPVYNSNEQKLALVVVKNSMEITSAQAKSILFWGGAPGTETPSGIWQNRLYDMVKGKHLTDYEYSYAQMVLAQSLADSFIECWKVKYTYWTKRPNMADKEITLIWMDNPKFPSYISGHASVSFTAAVVLSALFPEYKNRWFADATEAKNTRLWAGIHFPYDLDEGQKLGVKVGEVIVKKLNLKEIR